jgi:hypothetical protein
MLPVFDLDPVLLTTAAVWSIAMLRNQAFKSELACFAKKVRPDLSLLELAEECPIRPPSQQAGQIGLAHRERQVAEIVTVQESKASLV